VSMTLQDYTKATSHLQITAQHEIYSNVCAGLETYLLTSRFRFAFKTVVELSCVDKDGPYINLIQVNRRLPQLEVALRGNSVKNFDDIEHFKTKCLWRNVAMKRVHTAVSILSSDDIHFQFVLNNFVSRSYFLSSPVGHIFILR